MANRRLHRLQRDRIFRLWICLALVLTVALFSGCAPTAEGNVLGYLAASKLGTLGTPDTGAATGAIAGEVTYQDRPAEGITVVVAERSGVPHSSQTDAEGRYRIDDILPGQYVPAAVGAGFDELTPVDVLGISRLVTVRPGELTQAPRIELQPHIPASLPENLADAVNLTRTRVYTATSLFPPGAMADVFAYQFERDGVINESVRVYLPPEAEPGERLPLLFIVYPGAIEGWEPVSVAFADQGFALVALSPVADWGTNIEEHTVDARIVLELARAGALTSHVGEQPAVAMGGSFSSAILHRLLRDEGDKIAAWSTVGGVSNAFSGTADYYDGKVEIPGQYTYLIPALGLPNIYPLEFLRYSPVYTADQLPPTMIVHTDADRIIPIEQAYELEEAARAAGVQVETFYYDDTSHYLQVDENMPEVTKEIFSRIIDFSRRYLLEP